MSIGKLVTLIELLQEWQEQNGDIVDGPWTIEKIIKQAQSDIVEAVS